MIAIVGIRYRNYTHHALHRSCLPIYGIAIVRSLSFSFINDFEGTLTFLSLSNPVLQYDVFIQVMLCSLDYKTRLNPT